MGPLLEHIRTYILKGTTCDKLVQLWSLCLWLWGSGHVNSWQPALTKGLTSLKRYSCLSRDGPGSGVSTAGCMESVGSAPCFSRQIALSSTTTNMFTYTDDSRVVMVEAEVDILLNTWKFAKELGQIEKPSSCTTASLNSLVLYSFAMSDDHLLTTVANSWRLSHVCDQACQIKLHYSH